MYWNSATNDRKRIFYFKEEKKVTLGFQSFTRPTLPVLPFTLLFSCPRFNLPKISMVLNESGRFPNNLAENGISDFPAF